MILESNYVLTKRDLDFISCLDEFTTHEWLEDICAYIESNYSQEPAAFKLSVITSFQNELADRAILYDLYITDEEKTAYDIFLNRETSWKYYPMLMNYKHFLNDSTCQLMCFALAAESVMSRDKYFVLNYIFDILDKKGATYLNANGIRKTKTALDKLLADRLDATIKHWPEDANRKIESSTYKAKVVSMILCAMDKRHLFIDVVDRNKCILSHNGLANFLGSIYKSCNIPLDIAPTCIRRNALENDMGL